MDKQNDSINYELIKQQALEQFRSGKSLTGRGGVFAPLFKQFLEAALEAELQNHLSPDNAEETPNRKMVRSARRLKPPMVNLIWLPAVTATAVLNPGSLRKGKPF